MEMTKAEKKRSEPSWGNESEKKFIDGMGTGIFSGEKKFFVDESSRAIRSYRSWLTMYIKAHENSPHSHHIVGVIYAQKKLKLMNEA
jgi:hypothetical protein